MPDRDYSHRDVVDKLGIKPGHAAAFAGSIDEGLVRRILERTGREAVAEGERVDVAIVAVNAETDVPAVLRSWRSRLVSNGGIWLLTPKRGRPGCISQDKLIPAGSLADLVDNKICSVSETTSAMRFVIRRRDRG